MSVMIWDGLQFSHVSKEEAERLVKEDKAEICVGGDLKYRHQFTGYMTRELRADPVVEVVEAAPPPAPDWEDYKDEAKKALGLKRIGKEKVLEWMAENGLI